MPDTPRRTTRHAAVPHGSWADRARRNINRRLRELGLRQRDAAPLLGFKTQQTLSDRAAGETPWRLNELEAASTLLDMDLSEILAPVVEDDTDLDLAS